MSNEQFTAHMAKLTEIHQQVEAANLMNLRSNAVLLGVFTLLLALVFFSAMKAVRRG